VLDFTSNYEKFLPSCCHQETLFFILVSYVFIITVMPNQVTEVKVAV
jgi:hypothetical protein